MVVVLALTCSRYFRYPLQRSNLSHLEGRFNFMTAVAFYTLGVYRQRHYQNNPPEVNT